MDSMTGPYRYSWLLFDVDGTLLDYDAAEDHALGAAAAAFGLKVTPEVRSLYRSINAALWAELEKGTVSSAELRVLRFDRLAARLGMTLDAASFSEAYLAELSRAGFLIDGAREMLDGLPETISKAVITNGIRDTQYGRLTRAGILDEFDHIVISETAGAAKPSPLFFDYLMDLIGDVPLERMLVIGDSLSSDIAGGVGYGIDTCWFNPGGKANDGPHAPTYEISDWREFVEVIGTDRET